ncbi:MAG TPA: type I-U CRISPR-associated protein Csb2, partial [Gemmataceae bacterium]|nr:type I-U CRISPR-associated protein Csb2 [Gemmataceae bacterium]
MSSYLCLSLLFLDSEFHGRRDGDQPEWPPSPLRVFQALVAAAAARWGEQQWTAYAAPALKWLAEQPPPRIVAPPGSVGAAYRLSVPNNAMDVVGRAWARGNESGKGDANPATHRAMKTVRPVRLPDDRRSRWPDDRQVSYLWELPDPLTDEVRQFAEVLCAAARSVVALGWGIDLVAGNGRVISAEDAGKFPGERWLPTTDPGAGGLRVPIRGTVAALTDRHAAFLGRLRDGGFIPVPPLAAFAVVGYRRETDAPARPFAAFEL